MPIISGRCPGRQFAVLVPWPVRIAFRAPPGVCKINYQLDLGKSIINDILVPIQLVEVLVLVGYDEQGMFSLLEAVGQIAYLLMEDFTLGLPGPDLLSMRV